RPGRRGTIAEGAVLAGSREAASVGIVPDEADAAGALRVRSPAGDDPLSAGPDRAEHLVRRARRVDGVPAAGTAFAEVEAGRTAGRRPHAPPGDAPRIV